MKVLAVCCQYELYIYLFLFYVLLFVSALIVPQLFVGSAERFGLSYYGFKCVLIFISQILDCMLIGDRRYCFPGTFSVLESERMRQLTGFKYVPL